MGVNHVATGSIPANKIHSAPTRATIPSQPCRGNARRRRRPKNPATRTVTVAAVTARPIARRIGKRNVRSSIGLSAYGSAVGRSFRRAPARFLLCSACFFRREATKRQGRLVEVSYDHSDASETRLNAQQSAPPTPEEQ